MNNYFIHPNGICESTDIGEGTRIWAFTHVMRGARIGQNCNIGESCYIEGRAIIGDYCTIKNGVAIWDMVELEDYVFVGPYAVFTNDLRPRAFIKKGPKFYLKTLVKKGATIGANSVIVCGVTLGEFSFIGAGSVVTNSVEPFSLVFGNPARTIGKVCYCGNRLKDDFCESCGLFLKENSMDKARFSVISRSS